MSRRLKKDKPTPPWKTDYHTRSLTPLRPKTYLLATREEWSRRGKQPKKGIRPYLMPYVPSSEANLHIRNIKVFSQEDVEDKPQRMADDQRYQPKPEPLQWTKFIFYQQGYGAARKRGSRTLDKYKFVPVRMTDKEWKNVPESRTTIYPASLFRYARQPKDPEEKRCEACEKTFTAKRKDAKYCSPACRKWASRRSHR